MNELLLWINRYLTKQFIADPDDLPSNECEHEAKVILDMCKPPIEQEAAKGIFEEIEKESASTHDGINHYCPNCDNHIIGLMDWKLQALKEKYLGCG